MYIFPPDRYLNVILFILLVTFLIIANTRYPINEVNLAKVNIDDSDLEPNLQPGDSISERKVGNKYVLLYNEFWKDLTWTTGLNTVGPEVSYIACVRKSNSVKISLYHFSILKRKVVMLPHVLLPMIGSCSNPLKNSMPSYSI